MDTNDKQIIQYLHCGLCVKELLSTGGSPRDYAETEIGWTEAGLQVWCRRHDCNIIHIDFEGVQHRADTTRKV